MSSKLIYRWLIALAFVMAAAFGLRLSLSAQWSNGLNFGAGRGVQIVDPSGSNRMPVWPGQGAVTVDYTLYPLAPADFVKRIANYDPYSNTPINLSGLNASNSWQQSYNATSWDVPESATLPANVTGGLYVIQGNGGAAGSDTEYIVVSHTTLMVKKAAGNQVIVWATNLHGQSAVAGLTVTLYDKAGNTLGQATTDGSGVAHFTVSNGAPYMAIADGNGEMSVAGMDWQWASDGYYWWWDTGTQSNNAYTLYLYTDRPIYRPTQTIYYQAFLRQNALNGYSQIDTNTPISLTLRDARNNQVATQSATVDAFGALTGQFTIGDSPALGWWTLELAIDGQTHSQTLRVEEYRKPEYQVTVSSDKEVVIAGDSAQITVAADYYFGQPVANAHVRVQVYRYTIPRYGWYWWYDYAPQPYYTTPIAELTGTTGANGKWTTSYSPEATDQYDAFYTFSAEVTDARNLPVAGSKQLAVYWNSFQMSVTPLKWGYQSDETVQMDVKTRNHDGSPAAGKTVNVRIIRDYWDGTPESDAVPPQSGVTDGQGKVSLNFSAVPQGWYRVEATSSDARGRQVLAINYLWVFDPAASSWYYFNNNELSILTDKDIYKPGDTAELLIQSKVQGIALLTLERDGVYREQIVEIKGPVTTVNVPIDEQLAPNVYAHLHLFTVSNASSSEWEQRREGRLVNAQKELVVPATNKKLKVEISANAAQYRPAENAQFTLKVSDAAGIPVQARVSLALVDEAIYALQSDLSADLFDTFWGRRANRVQTYDSLSRQPWGYNAVPESSPTGTPAPTTTPTNDGDTPRELTTSVEVRRRFEDTAYWNATITTDANGQAVVNVTLPDNLTTWRVLVKAIAVDARVGTAQSDVLVTQAIIARPALPRFAVVGDRFQTGLVAQNFSGSDTSGSANLAADGLLLLDPGAKNVTLANAGSAAVDWTAVAARSGTGLVTSTLQTNRGGDAVELPFPVKPFAVPDRWLAAGQANLAATETFDVPLNAVTEQTQLEVRLSPSLAIGVLDGLDELIDYPYGCVEQTMSRLLPSAVASKAYVDLNLPNPKADELPAIVEQGLQKIYGFQHSDGSWGWFYDDSGGTFLTSYVLFGLQSVQDAGFTVDETVVERGFGYLDSTLASTVEPGVRAFAAYVKALAGRGDLAESQALVSQTSVMDASQMAALALALHLNGDDSQANNVLNTLLSRAKETTTTLYWPLTGDPWQWNYWQTMSSEEKNSALAVRALAQLRPSEPKLAKAVRWLLENRHGAGWGNTQATAFAVLGLIDVIQSTGELQSNYSYVVKLNDQTIASGQVTPASATQPIPAIQLKGEQLLAGDNRLQIEHSAGPGALYYSAILNEQLYYDGFTPVSSQDQGLALTRSYRLLEGTSRPDGAYNLGDLVEVTLKLQSNQELSYVLISDPIPAGFEVVQERMNQSSWESDWDYFYWRSWGYNQKEAHDDRVEYFVTYLWKGEHTFTYLMRATAAGDFSVLPGTASPMYKEEVWGRSASQRVLVAPEKLAALPLLTGDFDHSCQITAFDTQLTAAHFASDNAQHDLNSDGAVDLLDVAAVGSWQGSSCGTQHALPGTGSGSANFAIANDEAIQVGNELRLSVSLAALNAANGKENALGGFALRLQIDPARLTFQRIELNPALGKVIPLLAQGQGGAMSAGLYGLSADLPAGTPLATLVFRGSGVGSTPISIGAVNAVDGAGREIEATATGGGDVQVTGQQVWLPVIRR